LSDRVKINHDRATIAVYSLSEIANVIGAAGASFIELIGVGEDAIDRIKLSRRKTEKNARNGS
jgi:hypothetical protein